MTSSKHDILRLTETDLDFLIRVVSPEVSDKSGLKRIIREDEDIRNRFFTEEKVFRRVLDDEEISFRIKKGFWKTIRFNDMDIQSLISFCEVVEEEHRLGLYKRIADICLFMLGLFPDYTEREFRYPFSGQPRPPVAGQPGISPEEYEEKGRQFYRLAARHQAARDLADVFQALCNGFQKARKPLSFMAEHYLHGTRRQLFG